MAGGMFASHYESGGDIVEIDGKLYKQFYGTICTHSPTHLATNLLTSLSLCTQECHQVWP